MGNLSNTWCGCYDQSDEKANKESSMLGHGSGIQTFEPTLQQLPDGPKSYQYLNEKYGNSHDSFDNKGRSIRKN